MLNWSATLVRSPIVEVWGIFVVFIYSYYGHLGAAVAALQGTKRQEINGVLAWWVSTLWYWIHLQPCDYWCLLFCLQEAERLKIHELLETETITASVLRYKLQYFPSDIKSEIQGMIHFHCWFSTKFVDLLTLITNWKLDTQWTPQGPTCRSAI